MIESDEPIHSGAHYAGGDFDIMDMTYSDLYVLFHRDARAEAYFNELPGFIQTQIKHRKHQPASYEDLVKMAEEADQAY